MENLSAFDVIGPIMIGPSSSHTAGALRIASLARKIAKGDVKRAEFVLYGSFAETYRGHGTDRALVAGILGFDAGDSRIRDSFEWAKRAGVEFTFRVDAKTKTAHPNTVDITVSREKGGDIRMTGVSTGGGAAEIRQLNDVALVLTGEYNTILVKQKDEPGVAAHVTNCLADGRVNIAFMRLYREGKGKTAYTIVETDQRISDEVLRRILDYPSIVGVTLIE